ncbi:MAG: hypothetical protein MI861_17845, partial [Pirellulales bacterium]|nr:hypothetical protein [Pirellulales bacterium]
MYQTLRTWIWLVLTIGGVIGVLLTLIFSTNAMAVVVGIGVIATWVGWGAFSAWLFGLKRRVLAHMKRPIEGVIFVSKDVGASRSADYIQTFEHLYQSQTGVRLGGSAHLPLSQLKLGNIGIEQIDWTTIEGEDERLISVPSNSVYLLHHEHIPFVAKLSQTRQIDAFEHEDAVSTGKGEALELCARSLEEANAVLQWLSGQTSRHSIYRGQMLQVASPRDGILGQTIRVTRPPSAERESIILPDTILDLLQRLIHSRHKHRQQLAKRGHKTRLGILL